VIEAPYTGARVREIRKSMNEWRWPKAAGYALGGEVQHIASQAIRGRGSKRSAALARMLGVAGDPGGVMPGYGRRGPLYDQGGFLPPGPLNGTRKPEPVLTDRQWNDIHTLATRSGRNLTVNNYGLPGMPSDQQIASAVDRALIMHGL
jgi:hypothetical protein